MEFTLAEINGLESQGLITSESAAQLRLAAGQAPAATLPQPSPTTRDVFPSNDVARQTLAAAGQYYGEPESTGVVYKPAEENMATPIAPAPAAPPRRAVQSVADIGLAAAPVSAPSQAGAGDYGMGRIQGGLERQAASVAKTAEQADKAQATAMATQEQAIRESAALREAKAAEEAKMRADAALKIDAFDAKSLDRDQERQNHLRSVENELIALQKEAKDFKIRPGRVLDSFGNKILAAIASGLGAYASAYGVPNIGGQMVRDAIENDIAAQREELENKRGAVASKANELAGLRSRFKDDLQAEDARRLQLAERAEDKIRSVMGEYAAPEAKAEMERQIAELQAVRAEATGRILERANAQYVQAQSAAADLATKRAELDIRELRAGGKEVGDAPAGLELIPGQKPSREMINKAAGIKGAADAFRNAIVRLKGVRQRAGAGGVEVLDRSLVAEGNSAMAEAISAYKDAKELGALDKGSLYLAEQAIGGDPTGVGFKMSIYDNLLDGIDKDTSARLKPLGYRVAGGQGGQGPTVNARRL